MYLDGDDYLSLGAVERLLDVMKEYPADFIQFRYKEVEENERIKAKKNCTNIYQASSPKELFENLYKLGGVAASGATKFLRREIMIKNPFMSVQHEDEMWCTETFNENLTVTYIEDELYYYVMRPNSIIHSTFNCKKLDLFKVLDERIKVLEKLELYDLLGITYQKIFVAILELYIEADDIEDKNSKKIILNQFIKYQKNIEIYGTLDKKYKILFKLMKKEFRFIKIYKIYRARKR